MDSVDKRQIAGMVKAGRVAKGYTQQELADKTGITLRSIQRIESGEVLPRAYTVRLLEEQLGISLPINVLAILTKEPTNKPITTGDSKPGNLAAGSLHDRISSPIAGPSQQRGWSKGRKWVLTICLGLLLSLITIAYLAQSSRWPETDFERLLLWSGVLAIYSGILWKVWK